MAELMKRDRKAVEAFDPFARFDQLFEEWSQMLPFRRPSAVVERLQDQMIRVDEYRDGDTLVIRAEMPGMDPEKDVEVTVADNLLTIRAQRREEEQSEDAGYLRRELRTGSFSRTLSLPEGVSQEDISAGCRHGILEIRVPVPETRKPETRRIPVES